MTPAFVPRSARGAALLVLAFLLALPAVTTRIYASDEIQYFAFLRSVWFDHDLSFDNEYRAFYDAGVAHVEGFRQTYLEPVTPTGHRINFGTVGPALLWAPFYGAADVYVKVMHGQEARGAEGYSSPYIAAVCYASAFYGLCALLLSIQITRRFGPADPASAAAIWIGTPLLFYMYVAPAMAHAVSAFAVALVLYTWLRVRDRLSRRGLILLAASAALVPMVREQDAFVLLGPAIDIVRVGLRALRLPARRREVATSVALGALTCLLVYSPQIIAYEILYGHFGPSKLVSRKMTWTSPHFLQVLISPLHGFFLWTPLAVVALLGFAVLFMPFDREPPHPMPDRRWVVFCLLLSTLAEVYVAGSVESWTVAGAFGQRRFVCLTAILVLTLSAVRGWTRQRSHRAWRVALHALIVVFVWWNLALTAEFGANLMNRQHLDLRDNAYEAFVVLPRSAPGLAYRYLFERSSFYQTGSGSAAADH
ncbi:MAG TPA: hypothetical protein VFX12_03540 [Vicinamibacterales bacterium]|nr:hypothetical protein [Vicinamibacterales bacterium]